MSVKVQVTGFHELKNRTYPYIGITGSESQIVYFISPRCGINIVDRGKSEYRTDWIEGLFLVFSGVITLENNRERLER